MEYKTVPTKITSYEYRRVRKDVARRLYNAGKEITMIPCKGWYYEGSLSSMKISNVINKSPFEEKIKTFVRLYCNDKNGRYPHYYVRMKQVSVEPMKWCLP